MYNGPPLNLRGGGERGWSFFKINNFGQTLHEINNLFQFYDIEYVIQFEISSAPLSRVEINIICPPPPWISNGGLTSKKHLCLCYKYNIYYVRFQGGGGGIVLLLEEPPSLCRSYIHHCLF